MWIAQYHRNEIPEGLDNSGFGVACASMPISSLTATDALPSTLFDFGAHHCPPSAAFSRDGSPMVEPPQFLADCTATFSAGFTAPIPLTTCMPDHAVFSTHNGALVLIEESFWHSEIFYSKFVRNDRTTHWKWRIEPEWPIDLIVAQQVNYCYHRFHFQYFHWLFDIMPRIWLLKTRSPYQTSDRWVVGPLNMPFHAASLALYDIKPEQCIWPQIYPPSVRSGIAASAVIQYSQAVRPEFTFREPLKTRPAYNNGIHHKGWSTAFVMDIRDRAHQRYAQGAVTGHEMIFVHRSGTGHRAIRNEAEVLSLVTAAGFQVVDPGTLPFAQQVRLFANARAVLGVHGAGLTNILWCNPGAMVLELLPERLDDIGYRFLSNLCGHAHAVLMCEQFEHPRGIAYADIAVNIDGLRRVMNQMIGLG